MKHTGITKVVLCLTALFLLGGVCGYALSTRQTDRRAPKAAWEEHWTQLRLREDIERLKLTPEQVAQARPSYDQLLADIRKVREQTARGIFRAVSAQGRMLSEQLTPEQREEYLKLTEERRSRFPRSR
jgi:Spy/CpxP family protein refolding chaperone